MNTNRREFTKLLGASAVAPLAAPAAGLTLWERAELEVQQTGEVSPELTRALLDAQGSRGIFEEPEHFEVLRAALARKIRDHRILRSFPLPADIEPLLNFEA
ncbi:MAG: hypothetical protein HY701_11080 [Gemmatimonadetes bacterium]|nr:hypothetical protein [Gemmatimonadota bacterium]